MKEKIQKLLTIFVLLNEAKKQFKEFEDSVPTDLCDADYISQYPRNKFNDAITDSLESLWEVIGKVAKHDINDFLPLAVQYFTECRARISEPLTAADQGSEPQEL